MAMQWTGPMVEHRPAVETETNNNILAPTPAALLKRREMVVRRLAKQQGYALRKRRGEYQLIDLGHHDGWGTLDGIFSYLLNEHRPLRVVATRDTGQHGLFGVFRGAQ